MTACNEILAHLPLFVGGDLEAPLAAGVRAHLGGPQGDPGDGAGVVGARGCASCREALERLRRARGELLELHARSPAPAVDVWPGVRAVLAAEGRLARPALGEPAQAAVERGTVVRMPRWMPRRAAAAALLITCLGLAWALRAGGPGPRAPDAPAPIAEVGEPAGAATVRVADTTPGTVVDPRLVVPATNGGLRRLEPGEALLRGEPLPFVEGLRGWAPAGFPARLRGMNQPVVPTLASDRSLR